MVTKAALTLCLHLFAFWVASFNANTEFLAFDTSTQQLEANVSNFLETLKVIGVSSTMSIKAHQCLSQHFEFLKTLGESITLPVLRVGPQLGKTMGKFTENNYY